MAQNAEALSIHSIGNEWNGGVLTVAISRWRSGVKYENCFGMSDIMYENGTARYINASLFKTNTEEVKCALYYSSNDTFIASTEEKSITSATAIWYRFNFSSPQPVLKQDVGYYVTVYADAPDVDPGVNTNYVFLELMTVAASSKNCWMDTMNNYPVFRDPVVWVNVGNYIPSIYCVYTPLYDSTALVVFNNTAHTTGKYETQYNTGAGWKVWMNFTGNQSGLVVANNSVNTTGTIEYEFRPLTGVDGEWWVWVNLTGNGTGGVTYVAQSVKRMTPYLVIGLGFGCILGGMVLNFRRRKKNG